MNYEEICECVEEQNFMNKFMKGEGERVTGDGVAFGL